jgi:hypothetical protein
MAFDADFLTVIGSGNGFHHYRYDTLDGNIVVDASGYFNNSDDNLNLAVGDLIDVFDWATAVRSGTLTDWGTHVVVSVGSSGVVDLSDMSSGTITDSD